MAVTIEQQEIAENQYCILEEAIIDLQHCIQELRKAPFFSDYASMLTDIRQQLGKIQSDCEKVLDDWNRQQERMDRIAYERSVL